MSQENTEVVQAAYRAFNAADEEALRKLVAEDLVIETMLFDQGTFHGDEGRKAYRQALREAWGESVRGHPEEITQHGEHVLAMARTSAKGTASGARTDVRVAHLFTIQGGKIARLRIFRTRQEALEAVGLRE